MTVLVIPYQVACRATHTFTHMPYLYHGMLTCVLAIYLFASVSLSRIYPSVSPSPVDSGKLSLQRPLMSNLQISPLLSVTPKLIQVRHFRHKVTHASDQRPVQSTTRGTTRLIPGLRRPPGHCRVAPNTSQTPISKSNRKSRERIPKETSLMSHC